MFVKILRRWGNSWFDKDGDSLHAVSLDNAPETITPGLDNDNKGFYIVSAKVSKVCTALYPKLQFFNVRLARALADTLFTVGKLCLD